MVARDLLVARTDDFSKVFRALAQKPHQRLGGPDHFLVFCGGNDDNCGLAVLGDRLRPFLESELHHFAKPVLRILKLPTFGNHETIIIISS